MLLCRYYVIVTVYITSFLATLSNQIPNKVMPAISVEEISGGQNVLKNVENFPINKLRGRLKPSDRSIWNNKLKSRIYNKSLPGQLFHDEVGDYAPPSSQSRDSSAELRGRREKFLRKESNLNVTRNPAEDFAKHSIIYPHILHSRTKRELRNTWDTDGHHNHITVGLIIDGKDVLVDLQLNRDLLASKYYERQVFKNGSHIVHHPSPQDADMCHYQGFIKDRPGSWAAISTCEGISGVIFDGSETHYVEPMASFHSADNPHYLLSQRDLIGRNFSCGYKGSSNSIRDLFQDEEFNRLLRLKRSSEAEVIRGPFNSGPLSRYVELFLVMDKSEYEKYNNNEKKIYRRCKAIVNIVNALYQPLNIFIALTGVEIWKEEDQVEVSTDGDKTLTNFLQYRKLRLIPNFPNDNAQLLTGKLFDSGVVGKALKGPICTYQYSGGVNMDHSESVGLVATTVAHEMGHNFGMEHDTDDCECSDKRCIMAPSSGTKSPSHWSSCSKEYLAISFERSMDYCLRNRPTSLFQSPVCGNGFVEPGEQCDCGLPQHCDNPCCNASSCMLFSNATCATGHCCDLSTCRPKLAGTECRQGVQQCDLPEYCSGDSEYCPDNSYKENGMECKAGKEKAYCYEGSCRTHENQCRLLWGPTGKNSHDRCYKLNLEGNTNGNCGYDWANNTYMKCNSVDIKCGMMHCKHFNERLEFGMESVSKVSHRFIADKSQGIIPCRVAQVDLGLDMVDPGLAPDGAKCGYNKMCVNQKCMGVASLKTHMCNCNGHGVCNNKGHCHCNLGFAWPDCRNPGLGGSEDSGPASNPHATSKFVAFMFIFFLGIIPCGVIVALLYYARGNIKPWLLKQGKSPPRLPLRNINIKSKSGPTNVANKNIAVKIATNSAGSSPSQGSKSNSPLLNGYAKGDGQFQTNFFGHHEGFSLSPIKESSTDSVNNPQKKDEMLNKGNIIQSPTGNVNKMLRKHPIEIQSPTGSVNIQSKVQIGEPSLCASTNPAVEGPNTTILRPAPAPPRIPPVAVVSPYRRAPSRPLSVPDATTLVVRHSPSLDSTTIDGIKEQKQSAVARFASFLGKKEKVDVVEVPIGDQKCNTLPRKATKINRENLMNMEISHPMQLQATQLPSNLMPVRAAPQPPMQKKTDEESPVTERVSPTKVSFAPDVKNETTERSDAPSFLRSGSVRAQSVTSRPFIPKFGSMRMPRPKSLPPTRPSQPPPRPPLPDIPITSEPEYYYEDCTSWQQRSAPLAYEEGSSPQESIYATIDDESPVAETPPVTVVEDKKSKKSLFSRFYSKPKKKLEEAAPPPKEPLYCNIDNDVSLGESGVEPSQTEPPDNNPNNVDGLLSEIVTELANREPQYINSLSADENNASNDQVEYSNTGIHATDSGSPSRNTSPPNASSWRSTKLTQSSSAADNLRSMNLSQPRGVLSYLNKTKSQESPTAIDKNSNKEVQTRDKQEGKSLPRSTSVPVPKTVSSPTIPKTNTIPSLTSPTTEDSRKDKSKSNVQKYSKISRPPMKAQSSVPLPTLKEKAEHQKKPGSLSMPKISTKPNEPVCEFGKKTIEKPSKPVGLGPTRAKSATGLKTAAQKTPEGGAAIKDKFEPGSKPNLPKKIPPLVKPDFGSNSKGPLKPDSGSSSKGLQKPDSGPSSKGPLKPDSGPSSKGTPKGDSGSISKGLLKGDPGSIAKGPLKGNARGPMRKNDTAKATAASSRSGVFAAAARAGGTSNVATLQQKFESDAQNK